MPEPCDLFNNEWVIDKTRSEHWLRSRVNLNWTIQIWWFMIEVKLCLSETCDSNFLVALWPYLAWDEDEATLNEATRMMMVVTMMAVMVVKTVVMMTTISVVLKMMMMLKAMRKDRIGWRDKSSPGPRGAKRPPLLSSQMAAQNQMALVAMMRILMLLMNA